VSDTPFRTVLDRLEIAGRTLTAVALWLLLGATVGGLVFPGKPGFATPPGYHVPAKVSAPERLLIPSLRIDAPIVPIEVTDDATLDPPSNPREVGWWQDSAKPGQEDGQTVITGHTVHTGGGQMDHLGSITEGASIQVVTKDSTVWYRETSVVVYTKEQLSEHAEDLFNQDRPHNRLVLITCTGWTGSEYTSNVIVFAQPLGVPDDKPTPKQLPSKAATQDAQAS
jgi:LPXTG-site transpeptidase (sortase) family protein